MRLYTVKRGTEECVAVRCVEGGLLLLDTLGIKVRDMNDLICRYDELQDSIIKACVENDGNELNEEDYKILAPIPASMQDVVCLGVNYREHIEETVDVIDFTQKKDKKGGTFAIHDIMSKSKYGDMQSFTDRLRDMGYSEVNLIDTTDGKFMSKSEAQWMGLSGSTLLVGRK